MSLSKFTFNREAIWISIVSIFPLVLALIFVAVFYLFDYDPNNR